MMTGGQSQRPTCLAPTPQATLDEGKFRELVQLFKEFIEDLEAMITRLDIARMDRC